MKRQARFRRSAPDHSRLRRVEGRHNLLVKELRRAFRMGEPTADGFFAIEGVRIIDESLRSQCQFRAVFFSESARGRIDHILPQLAADVETLLLPDLLFESAVNTESPQGVAALVRLPRQATLESISALASEGPLLVAAGIQDPGNLGTMLRSAEAFGVPGVLLAEGTVSEINPKVVRASAGSVFRISCARARLDDILLLLREKQCRMVATSSHRGTPLPAARLHPPIAIFIGNEGSGVPRATLDRMDDTIAIPQASSVESLNAAMAASIVLYESFRQRTQSA